AGRKLRDRVPRRLDDRASREHARPPRARGRAANGFEGRPGFPGASRAYGGLGGPSEAPHAVMKQPTQLPKGARIYLPDEARRKRHVEAQLFDVFGRWGYREIVTPTFEFFEVLSVGTDAVVQEDMFKLVDRETGRLLALRADITPQIARIVATRLRDEPKPLRLVYVTKVFRYDEPRMGHY